MRPAAVVIGLAALLFTACSGTESPDDAGTQQTTGGSCNRAADCPAGFACKARACVTTCTSNQPVVGGCVVGATCNDGQCDLNTTCDENNGCAFDKGKVCQFSTGQCIDATRGECTEGENETLCGNGYLCNVSVCYVDCEGSKGCPSNQTCVNHACQ